MTKLVFSCAACLDYAILILSAGNDGKNKIDGLKLIQTLDHPIDTRFNNMGIVDTEVLVVKVLQRDIVDWAKTICLLNEDEKMLLQLDES